MKILLKSWNFLTFPRFPRKSKNELNTSLLEMKKGYVLPHNHFLPLATFQLDDLCRELNWKHIGVNQIEHLWYPSLVFYHRAIHLRYRKDTIIDNQQLFELSSTSVFLYIYFKKIFRTSLFYKTALSDFFWNACDHILHVA